MKKKKVTKEIIKMFCDVLYSMNKVSMRQEERIMALEKQVAELVCMLRSSQN